MLSQNPIKDNSIISYMNVKEDTKHKEEGYNPYMNNNGTVISFVGQDYLMLASDTRLSVGYSILSRNSPKIFRISEKTFLASSGMYADIMALVKNLKIRIDIYKSKNNSEPSIESLAQLLSITLYGKRFFPYYTFNVLAGVNDKGEFKMYGYDAIGSYDCLDYGANGSGKELVIPVLDSVLKYGKKPDLETGKRLAKSAMSGCSNRDIYTGDNLHMVIIKTDGSYIEETYPLRDD